MDKGKSALTYGAAGAAAGAPLGPIGAAVGGVGGALWGYFSGDDGDSGAPGYSPDQYNFDYGLGFGVDANGVVHPTPEERAAAEKAYQDKLNQISEQKRKALLVLNNPNATPEQLSQAARDYDAVQPALDALDADYNAYNATASKAVDTYAAQRTRETIGRQQGLATVAEGALGREAPQQAMVENNGQSYLNGADTAGRGEQFAALGGLKEFAGREQGPSAAQAQLRAGVDMASRQQYGMARSQPGGGGSALRNAAFNAAGISGNAANSAAMLRAQEDQAYRQQQLAALGAVSSASGAFRAADQGFAKTQADQANTAAAQQIQVGQNNLGANLQSRAQNDSMFLGTNSQIMGYDAMRDSLAKNQQSAGMGYESAKSNAAGLGAANYNAAQAQDNTETAMMLGAISSGAGALGSMGGGSGSEPGAINGQRPGLDRSNPYPTSDVRAKKDIERVDVLKALGGSAPSRSSYPEPTQPDLAALDAAYASQGGAPNLRPAQGYEYAYRDPKANGEGRYVGPMAQDLEQLPGVVKEGPDGQKSIDAPRLTLANTAAVSDQQRRLDELERRQRLMALNGGLQAPAFPSPVVRQPDYAALDRAER